jgi:hypothetical protein
MLAMRPALYHREIHALGEKTDAAVTPAGIAAQIKSYGADASPDFTAQIAQARRDARLHPAQAAMLLRAWMSDHE